MRARRALVAMLLLGVALEPGFASAAPRADGRPWWDEKRKAYPQCNAMTDQHERLTDELERLADLAGAAVEPQRAAYVRQINATAKQRHAVQDQLFACIRASGGSPTPSTGQSGRKPQPPLSGRVEETDQPQKSPPGDPGPTPGPGGVPGPTPPGGSPGIPGGSPSVPGGPPQSPGSRPPSGPATRPPCVDPRVASESAAAGGDPIYMSAQQAQAIQRQEPLRLRKCIPDICNRPSGRVCWLNQEARTQPVPGRPDVGRPDGGDLPGDVRAGLQERARELRAIRSDPGANPLDEYLRGAADMLIGMLEFLAQPRGDFNDFGAPAKQLLDYMMNHKPESHAQRYKNALKAVDEFKKNPAYALGKATPGAVSAAIGLKLQYARELEAASKQMLAANATVNRFVNLEQEVAKAARARGPVPPNRAPDVGPPPTSGGPPRSPRPPNRAPDPGLPPGETPVMRDPTTLPPTCYFNQCYRNAMAVYRWQRTGHWVAPTPSGYQYIDELSDLPVSNAKMTIELRKTFGGDKAMDPGHGPGGQQLHAQGLPVLSSREKIDDVMRQLKDKGFGLALIDKEWVDASGKIQRAGHIVNVRGTPTGGSQYYDHFAGGEPHVLEWAHAKAVYFMRLP